MAAWVAGQGTLQVCCLDRVRAVDAGYTMADLLEDINSRAIPPAFWDDVRTGLISALDLEAQGHADPMPTVTELIGKPRSGGGRRRSGARRTSRDRRMPGH
jgi:hypothetical protein